MTRDEIPADLEWSKWVEWSGGECPISNGTEYTVKLRGGVPMDIEDKPEELDWHHRGSSADIIAYRYRLDNNTPTPEEDEAWKAMEEKQADMVNNPPHYNQGGIECIEAIKAALTPEEFRGYCKGNAIKYIWRELHKGGDESLRKADWYIASALRAEELEG